MHQLICSLVAACIVLGAWSRNTDPLSLGQLDQIYVFGDSLSDTGNVFQVTEGVVPPSPPYGQGRFSDGPVWVEYLTSRLGLSPSSDNNFAFGGATTGAEDTHLDNTVDPPGLLAQVKNFAAANPNANPNALYVIWAGANDYLGGGTDPAVPLANLSKAVSSIAAIGGKNILVVNLPDLGRLPATLNSPSASTLNHLTRTHNSALSIRLEMLSQSLDPDTKVRLLDVNFLFDQAITEPAKFGFTNVTTPCLVSSVVCSHPNEFLFWDNIHPTTAGHQVLGKLAFLVLTPVSIPEPWVELGVLVLGTGVAGLQSLRLGLRQCKKRNYLTSSR